MKLICKGVNKAPKDTPPLPFTKFVLKHLDISPRNLVLGSHGQVWLVDWGYSGAYPPDFGRAILSAQLCFPDFNKKALAVIPRFPEEEAQLDFIAYGLTTAT